MSHTGHLHGIFNFSFIVEENVQGPQHKSTMKDLRDYFSNAGFTENPENTAFFQQTHQQHLGNVKWVSDSRVQSMHIILLLSP